MYGGYEFNGTVDAFTAKCDEAAQSGYILADNKISNLIKFLVTSSETYEILEESLRDFNYELEFMKARTGYTVKENITKYHLNLPSDRNKLIAFCFCMLTEFDLKTKDLHDYLLEYFYAGNGNLNICYEEFCKSIIKPFKRAIELSLKDADEEIEKNEVTERAEKYFTNEAVPMSPAAVEQIKLTIQELTHKIQSDSSLNLSKKSELISVTDGLSNAVSTKEAKLIRIMWIGFKNTFKLYKPAQKILAILEEQLGAFWII